MDYLADIEPLQFLCSASCKMREESYRSLRKQVNFLCNMSVTVAMQNLNSLIFFPQYLCRPLHQDFTGSNEGTWVVSHKLIAIEVWGTEDFGKMPWNFYLSRPTFGLSHWWKFDSTEWCHDIIRARIANFQWCNVIFTARIRTMREGNVFTGVC